MRWQGALQPSALSPAYTVSLTYKLGGPPRMHVLEPALDSGHRLELPHVYESDRLCLYTPGDWNGTMQLAATILPWTAEWLFHYEVWRSTDRWLGGGNLYTRTSDARAARRKSDNVVTGG